MELITKKSGQTYYAVLDTALACRTDFIEQMKAAGKIAVETWSDE